MGDGMITMWIPKVTAVRRVMDRIIRGFKGSSVRLTGLARRCFILVPVIVLPLVLQASPCQKQEPDEKDPPVELTDEEKDIIRDRELLENLTLLQNLDAIEFIDLLNELEPDWSEKEDSDEPEKKEEG